MTWSWKLHNTYRQVFYWGILENPTRARMGLRHLGRISFSFKFSRQILMHTSSALQYVVNAPTRIYQFLRAILPVEFCPYLITFEAIHTILRRDPGNLGSQLHRSARCSVGWAMYPPKSFFNHSMSLIHFIHLSYMTLFCCRLRS
jgi:hypothetical protein